MRHKDKETIAEALQDWKRLRRKVEAEGGEQYEKPVLVQFLDGNSYEVMDRDIVEDEFYVLRKHRILRDLDPQGRDLDDALRAVKAGKPSQKVAPPGAAPGKTRGSQRRRRRRRGPGRPKPK